MSERYSRMFSLPTELYTSGAPVVIVAGALLKDSRTGSMLAQLKIRNIQKKIIKAVKVSVLAKDAADRSLGEEREHSYSALNVRRDEDFGQKSPIMLDRNTCAFIAKVTEVVFSDQTIWTADEQACWEPLTPAVSPESRFPLAQLAKEFRIQFGENVLCFPTRDKELWRCACGVFNHNSEACCHVCGRSYEVMARVTEEELLDRVKKKQELEQSKKRERRKILAVTAAVATAVVALLFCAGLINREINYQVAVNQFAQVSYTQTEERFEALGDYKDSKEWYDTATTFHEAYDQKSVQRYKQQYWAVGLSEKQLLLDRVRADAYNEIYRDEFQFAYKLLYWLDEEGDEDAEEAIAFCFDRALDYGVQLMDNRHFIEANELFRWLYLKTDDAEAAELFERSEELVAKVEMAENIIRLANGDTTYFDEFGATLSAEETKRELLSGQWLWIRNGNFRKADFKENGEVDFHDDITAYWSLTADGFTYAVYVFKPTTPVFPVARKRIRQINENILFYGDIALIRADSAYAKYITEENGFTADAEAAEVFELNEEFGTQAAMVENIIRLAKGDTTCFDEFGTSLSVEETERELLSGQWLWIRDGDCRKADFKENGEVDFHDGTASYWSVDANGFTYASYAGKVTTPVFTFLRKPIRRIDADILFYGDIALIRADSAYAKYITEENGFTMVSED
ncbi:MAG: hypothetical protein E7553_07055 [Ruminococcaceae bacterium]|nr:hypothetical protein [Oscillospiraceae bacterium]